MPSKSIPIVSRRPAWLHLPVDTATKGLADLNHLLHRFFYYTTTCIGEKVMQSTLCQLSQNKIHCRHMACICNAEMQAKRSMLVSLI